MPELPEVETVRRGLRPAMAGARFVAVEIRRGNLRFSLPHDFAARLTGQRVARLDRRAKYLLARLSSGDVLMMHLGMSGSFRVTSRTREKRPGRFHHPRGMAHAHDHVVFRMSSGKTVTYNDPRRFGFMKLVDGATLDREPHLKDLGPEPLARKFTAAVLATACAGKTTSLKAALLDQRVVAGLGNIYACEALFRAGLSPKKAAGRIATQTGRPTAAARRLVAAIRAVLREAIRAGGSSLRDHRRTDGGIGLFQHAFKVYDRAGKPCRRRGCGGTVRRIAQSGRSTFWCPKCQR
jgi:formamidopyrimidine-DNA glycosylase